MVKKRSSVEKHTLARNSYLLRRTGQRKEKSHSEMNRSLNKMKWPRLSFTVSLLLLSECRRCRISDRDHNVTLETIKLLKERKTDMENSSYKVVVGFYYLCRNDDSWSVSIYCKLMIEGELKMTTIQPCHLQAWHSFSECRKDLAYVSSHAMHFPTLYSSYDLFFFPRLQGSSLTRLIVQKISLDLQKFYF